MLKKRAFRFIMLTCLIGLASTAIFISAHKPRAGEAQDASDIFCIVILEPLKPGENSSSAQQVCFDNWAEAAAFATNGTVQLPPGATESDYIAAVDAYRDRINSQAQ